MIRYRTADAADVPVLRTMLQALSDQDGGDYQVASEQNLMQHGFGPHPLFGAAIAEQDGLAIGMVVYYSDYSTHLGQAGVYVQDIYVNQATRGSGVGRGLLTFMLKTQDWAASYICLGLNPANQVAHLFYNRLGFVARGYEMMILAGVGFTALQ